LLLFSLIALPFPVIWILLQWTWSWVSLVDLSLQKGFNMVSRRRGQTQQLHDVSIIRPNIEPG
jgi:hypothetical protein